MIVTSEVTVTVALEHDEVQWLRRILSRVSSAHKPSNKLYEHLNAIPGIEVGAVTRGFSGCIDYKEPT